MNFHPVTILVRLEDADGVRAKTKYDRPDF